MNLYLVFALVGTAVLAVLSAMSFVGFETDGWDLDIDMDWEPGLFYKVFVLQSLASFMMSFGWAGVIWKSAWIASVVGLTGAYLMNSMLVAFKKLEHEYNPDKNSLIGKTGTVYISIPENGVGEVKIVLGSKLETLDAVSKSGNIGNNTTVKVVDVVDNKLVVEAA